MSEALVYDAVVESLPDGTQRALILDLPGCSATGPDEASALRRLVAGVPAYYEWLRSHDEYTPIVAGPFEARVRERQQAVLDAEGISTASFADELAPLVREDLELVAPLLEWAYADLLHALSMAGNLASTAHQPAISTLIRQQRMLLSFSGPALAASADTTVRQLAEDVAISLKSVPDSALNRIAERAGGRWSLRKVINRSIILVREYTDLIRQ